MGRSVLNLKDKKHRKEPLRVPLSVQALHILREMQVARVSAYVFPGSRGNPLSNMAMLTLLKRMNSGDEQWLDPTSGRSIVPHGFRATFRTWCEETAHFPHAVIEEAMGHVVGTAVERAYRRTDVLEQRRALMAAWATHCEPRVGRQCCADGLEGGTIGRTRIGRPAESRAHLCFPCVLWCNAKVRAMNDVGFSSDDERWPLMAALTWIATRSLKYTECYAFSNPVEADYFLSNRREGSGAPFQIGYADSFRSLNEMIESHAIAGLGTKIKWTVVPAHEQLPIEQCFSASRSIRSI